MVFIHLIKKDSISLYPILFTLPQSYYAYFDSRKVQSFGFANKPPMKTLVIISNMIGSTVLTALRHNFHTFYEYVILIDE